MSVLESMKKRELRREYTMMLGEEKTEYYLNKFNKLTASRKKLSLNWAGLLFSTYWCFYRKLFLPGAVFLLLNFAGLYMVLMKPDLALLGNMVSVIPTVICGFFGNYLYMMYVQKSIIIANELATAEKEQYYANNGGTSMRIVLGILAAMLFFAMALFFSAGSEVVERLS